MSPLSFGIGNSRAFGIASSVPPEPFSLIYDFSNTSCYSGSGSTISDLSGSSNSTIVGASFDPSGFFLLNSASQGDGYIVMDDPKPEISPVFTIEMWVSFNTLFNGQIVLDNRFSVVGGIVAYVELFNSDFRLRFTKMSNGFLAPTALSTGTFYHFVVTQSSSQLITYTNNTRSTSILTASDFSASIINPFHFGISSINTGTSSSSNINLYEFRMYDRALSIAEVDARFQESRTKYGI
jgi:hypothetical protein